MRWRISHYYEIQMIKFIISKAYHGTSSDYEVNTKYRFDYDKFNGDWNF